MKRAHRRFHLAIWVLLLPALVIALVIAYQVRQDAPTEPRPELGALAAPLLQS